MCSTEDNKRLLSSLKSNILVINAKTIPRPNDIMKDVNQYMSDDFRSDVVVTNKMINDKMLIKNEIPNFKLNILFAMKN